MARFHVHAMMRNPGDPAGGSGAIGPRSAIDVFDRLLASLRLVTDLLLVDRDPKHLTTLSSDVLGQAVEPRSRDRLTSLLRLHLMQIVDRTEDLCGTIRQLPFWVRCLMVIVALGRHAREPVGQRMSRAATAQSWSLLLPFTEWRDTIGIVRVTETAARIPDCVLGH